MFSLEIIIPIIVVAAVCAVYIILRGRRDERRAREAGEKLRPIPMDDPLVAGGAAMRPAPDAPGNAGSEQHPVRACVKLFYCPVHFLSISKKHPAQALCRSAGRSSLQVSYDLTFL